MFLLSKLSIMMLTTTTAMQPESEQTPALKNKHFITGIFVPMSKDVEPFLIRYNFPKVQPYLNYLQSEC